MVQGSEPSEDHSASHVTDKYRRPPISCCTQQQRPNDRPGEGNVRYNLSPNHCEWAVICEV